MGGPNAFGCRPKGAVAGRSKLASVAVGRSPLAYFVAGQSSCTCLVVRHTATTQALPGQSPTCLALAQSRSACLLMGQHLSHALWCGKACLHALGWAKVSQFALLEGKSAPALHMHHGAAKYAGMPCGRATSTHMHGGWGKNSLCSMVGQVRRQTRRWTKVHPRVVLKSKTYPHALWWGNACLHAF